MTQAKTSILNLDIRFRQKIRIVNFDPLDIVTIANLFMETIKTIPSNAKIRIECRTWASDYRKWVRPLLIPSKCWSRRKVVDSRHLIGMEVKDASKLYDFIHRVTCELKEVPTTNADNIRTKLMAYNRLINDTIKICNKGL
jgi:hypothetical protein